MIISGKSIIGTIFSLWVVLGSSTVSATNLVEGIIETRILDFDPQAGVKSQHFFSVDFDEEKVASSYETGTTDFFGTDLDSVRDKFKIHNTNFRGDSVSFTISGSTGSGVRVLPNIDYSFDIVVSKNGKYSITGCHDGYPAYLIQMNGKDAYRYEHQSVKIHKLFGDCDTKVAISN